MERRAFVLGLAAAPVFQRREPNVYSLVPAGMIGAVWKTDDGVWHPAPFGSEIFRKMAKLLPEKKIILGAAHEFTIPGIPACPKHLLLTLSRLVCYPEMLRAEFLPDRWRPVT